MIEKVTEEMLFVANDFTLFKNNITRVYLLLHKSNFISLLYTYLFQTVHGSVETFGVILFIAQLTHCKITALQ